MTHPKQTRFNPTALSGAASSVASVIAALPIVIGIAQAQVLDTEQDTGFEVDESLGVDLKTGDEIETELSDEAVLTSEMQSELYNEADRDGNNYLSEEEFQTYANLRAEDSSFLAVQEEGDYEFWYDNADVNDDDVLSTDEFRNSISQIAEAEGVVENYQSRDDADIVAAQTSQDSLFRGEANDLGQQDNIPADANEDGILSREEFQTYVDIRAGQSVDTYATMDADQNYRTYYAAADANDDGQVSMAELDAELEQISEGTYEDATGEDEMGEDEMGEDDMMEEN